MATFLREDTFKVTAYIDWGDGTLKPFVNVWDTFSGGEVETDDLKYRPGNLGSEISLGGPKSVGDITLGVIASSDIINVVGDIHERAGKARAEVHRLALDADGNPVGNGAIVYRGTFTGYNLGDHDSNSSDAVTFEATFSVNEVIGTA